MNATKVELRRRMQAFEREFENALDDKQNAFRYYWSKGKARFSKELRREHKKFKKYLPAYVFQARPLVFLAVPVIYLGVVPFLLLDLFLTLYQTICFPIFGIPKVERGVYLVFDRGRLAYLNLLERLNCVYCSYANGLFAYATEIGARTEQHWCPIKHARRLDAPHSRYWQFLDYGDAKSYRQQIDATRRDFTDLHQ
ncbi:MAG: hypothetical protein WD733_00540 [Bryobacterales bacterium]